MCRGVRIELQSRWRVWSKPRMPEQVTVMVRLKSGHASLHALAEDCRAHRAGLQVVDACGLLINLRTAIIRYRQPRSLDRFFRCVRANGSWKGGVRWGGVGGPTLARSSSGPITLPLAALASLIPPSFAMPSLFPLCLRVPQARDQRAAQCIPALR